MSYIKTLNVTGIKEKKIIHERTILMPYRRNKKLFACFRFQEKKSIQM